jgi:hypothetical protein
MKIVNKENKFFTIFIKVIFILITNKKFFIKNISFPPSNIMKLNTIENNLGNKNSSNFLTNEYNNENKIFKRLEIFKPIKSINNKAFKNENLLNSIVYIQSKFKRFEEFYDSIYDKIFNKDSTFNKSIFNLRFKTKDIYNQKKIQQSNLKNLDLSKLRNTCSDIDCDLCDKNDINKCILCKEGLFLFNNKCFAICPNNYIADIYNRICRSLDSKSKKKIILLKFKTINIIYLNF